MQRRLHEQIETTRPSIYVLYSCIYHHDSGSQKPVRCAIMYCSWCHLPSFQLLALGLSLTMSVIFTSNARKHIVFCIDEQNRFLFGRFGSLLILFLLLLLFLFVITSLILGDPSCDVTIDDSEDQEQPVSINQLQCTNQEEHDWL